MKIKIKINEAMDTVAQDALADREAEEISNDFDAEDMDREIEAQVNRQEGKKELRRLLDQSPFLLPTIKELMEAHRKSVRQAYNIDGLWEEIKNILNKSQEALASLERRLPGIDLKNLVNVNIKLASELESSSEDYTVDQAILDLLTEELNSRNRSILNKFNRYIASEERRLGRELNDEEKLQRMFQFKILNPAEDAKDLSDIQTLLKGAGNYNRTFDKNIKKVIDNMAKKKIDPVIELTKNADLLNNLRTLYIITRIMDEFGKKAIKYMGQIVRSSATATRSADPRDAIDQLVDAENRFSEVYRKFDIKNVIKAASKLFADRIYIRAVAGQDKSIGSPAAAAAERAKEAADDIEVGTGTTGRLRENLTEVLKKEDYNTIFALALYRDFDINQIENLADKFKTRDEIDPEATQEQIFRIYNFFEEEYQRKFDQTLGSSLRKLKEIYKHPDINIPGNEALKDEIKNLIKDYLNKKNILNDALSKTNEKLGTDPKAWVSNFKRILEKLKDFSSERLKKDLADAKNRSKRLRRRRSDINTILLGMQPYEVTLDIATADKPDLKASQAIAYKISNNIELNNIEKQYYTNNSKEVEDQLKILQNLSESLLKENCIITNNSNVDVNQLENIVARFYPYVKEKLKFNKDAKLNFISDPENAKDPWGKTAYYNPNTMEITIFVDGRHPKDMLRSISHELVHHAQNCRGEFDKTQALEQGYAQKDPHMRRMEGEAYLLGNGFLVRDFEDYLKSQQNQNLTENKKMKGLTNEQFKAVLENTIKRVLEESETEVTEKSINEETNKLTESAEEGEVNCEKLYTAMLNAERAAYSDPQAYQSMDQARNAYMIPACADHRRDKGVHGIGKQKISEEEVVEEEAKNMVDCDGKMVPDYACDGKGKDDLKESFTSKKDQLLFEKLTNKWAK